MSTLHSIAFEHLKPTDEQMKVMAEAREAVREYAADIELLVPDGPDKTYILRKLREVAMWVNIAITRNPNGAPRP